MADCLRRRRGAQSVHRQRRRERPLDVADFGLLHAVRGHLHLVDRIGGVVGGDVLLKPHSARPHVLFCGIDARSVAEPRIDIYHDAKRIGTALGKAGDPFHELDRVAEQAFLVCPRTGWRPEHQRGGEQISPGPKIHVSAPSLPAKSPSRKIIGTIWLTQPSRPDYSAAVAFLLKGVGMTRAARTSSPSNSSELIRPPRFATFSAEVRICATSLFACPKCFCRLSTRSCRRPRSSIRWPTSVRISCAASRMLASF